MHLIYEKHCDFYVPCQRTSFWFGIPIRPMGEILKGCQGSKHAGNLDRITRN